MIMKGFISLAGTLIMLTKVEETNKNIKKDKIKDKKCSNLVPWTLYCISFTETDQQKSTLAPNYERGNIAAPTVW